MAPMDPEFPQAFATADDFSLHGQHRTLRGTSARLGLMVLATLFLALAPLWPTEVSEHREIELVGVAAGGLFLLAFLVEVWLLRARPERDWYDGRAVAESTKTLAWRYAVGGLPYPVSEAADEGFERDVRSLGTDIAALRSATREGGIPTDWMRWLRTRDLPERREAYLVHRIRDQEQWYMRKAEFNLLRAKMWSATLLTAEALGVVLSLLKSLSVIDIDLASIAAAVIASGAAWLAVKQHEAVGAAYTLASRELASVHLRLLTIDDEERWGEEVAGAEEAVSREHTMWRASRAVFEPTPSPRPRDNRPGAEA